MNSKPRITRSSNVKNVIALEKSKQCIVRLEDFKRQQRSVVATNSSTPQQQNKAKQRIMISSAVKKTPLQKILPKVPQSAPPRQQQNIVKRKPQTTTHDDDLDSSVDTSTFGRSRRTPKPNVKYFNDSVVTVRPGRKLKIEGEDDDDIERDSSSDVDFDDDDDKEDNVSEFDISEEEEDAPPAKKTRLSTTTVVHTAKPNLPTKTNMVVSKGNTVNKQQSMMSSPATRMRNILPVQKMAVKKPTIVEKPTPTSATANKKPMNIVSYTSSNNRVPVTRKRPLEVAPTTQKGNTQKIMPASRTTVQQKTVNNVQAIRPKPATNVVTNNSTGKSYTVVRRSTAAAVPSTQVAAKKEMAKKVATPQPQAKKKVVNKKVEEEDDSDNNDDNLEEDIGNPMALNTIDDFEAMPTFTIVNINDIINKKGDVLMQQTFPSEDKKQEDKQENTSKNRRKATHTVLKEEPSTKSPPPKTPFPPPMAKKTAAGPLKQIVMNKKVMISPPPPKKTVAPAAPVVQKPPVRILNSTLCRQQPPVSPIINSQKQKAAAQLQSMQSHNAKKETHQQMIVKKEPSQRNQPTPKHQPVAKKVLSPVKAVNNINRPLAKKLVPSPQAQKRKLPEEKVTVQRQGSKTIKKMTCFENWYVVHCPENEAPPKIIPNQLTLPLIKIANTLQEICLPSEKWTSKVALSLIPDMVYQRGQFEKYIGNYHDKAIVKDDQKHRYQPASILFRRSQKPNAIDRTVILRNRTYLIYIQGKCVQLVGSPKVVKDLQDIESLLDCVDHLALDSDDVDITPSAPSLA
ncbi:hypothetical protein ACFFRR_003216 [Megaselia abdita]